VTRIYLVDPGEMYPAASREVFVIGDVVIIEGGFNYQPGRVTDNFGNSYEVIVDDGTIIGIIPETLIPVTQEPIIDIPVLSPDNPDGTPAPGGVVYKPTLVRLPKAIDIIEGRVPDSIADRINQQTRLLQKEEPNTEFIQTGTTKISNVIDCVED